MLENLDLESIQDEKARELIRQLLNLVEQLSADLRDAQVEIQRLRDEINRLKGEQGKPSIKGSLNLTGSQHSSEKERRKPRVRHKKSKKESIVVDREEVLRVDRKKLPADAVFKGYEEVIVQDIIMQADNVLFRKEKYYSPSKQKTYLAAMPAGYEGQFGAGIKTMIPMLYYGGQMTEPKIKELLGYAGIQISAGQISGILIKGQEEYHAENDAVCEAGLSSSPYQHLDDTPARVNGKNEYCQILSTPVYTSYHTTAHKDRLSVLDVLRNGRKRIFCFNAEARSYLEGFLLSKLTRKRLLGFQSEAVYDERAFLMRLEKKLPNLPGPQRKAIIDAAAVAAYHTELGAPVIQTLICDDAPQFDWLTRSMMLCWVHEGRAYKKLLPSVGYHRDLLKTFLQHFWEYYDRLLGYREQPSPQAALQLGTEFDELFATQTGYGELDKRIQKTKIKKASLLLVLKHPELPLHNNPAELAARFRVRKRDISFGPRTDDGRHAWDTFMTLVATTKKLKINFYDYLRDRVARKYSIPPLAELIKKLAVDLNLGWSYSLP